MLKKSVFSEVPEPLFGEISKEQWAELKQRVKAAGDTAVLLVHPYYRNYSENSETYLRVLKSLLQKSRFPIIILEEVDNIPKLKKRLGKRIAQRTFIIPTVADNPDPLLKRKDPESQVPIEEVPKAFSKKAGIQNILIGGIEANRGRENSIEAHEMKMLIAHENTWMNEKGARKINPNRFYPHPTAAGCAGNMYYQLVKSNLFHKVRWIPNVMITSYETVDRRSPYARPKIVKQSQIGTRPNRKR